MDGNDNQQNRRSSVDQSHYEVIRCYYVSMSHHQSTFQRLPKSMESRHELTATNHHDVQLEVRAKNHYYSLIWSNLDNFGKLFLLRKSFLDSKLCVPEF